MIRGYYLPAILKKNSIDVNYAVVTNNSKKLWPTFGKRTFLIIHRISLARTKSLAPCNHSDVIKKHIEKLKIFWWCAGSKPKFSLSNCGVWTLELSESHSRVYKFNSSISTFKWVVVRLRILLCLVSLSKYLTKKNLSLTLLCFKVYWVSLIEVWTLNSFSLIEVLELSLIEVLTLNRIFRAKVFHCLNWGHYSAFCSLSCA